MKLWPWRTKPRPEQPLAASWAEKRAADTAIADLQCRAEGARAILRAKTAILIRQDRTDREQGVGDGR